MPELDLQITDLARELLMTALMLAAPVLIVGMIVGFAVSLFQALTSVQEQTMSLVPKMLVVMVTTLMLLAPALKLLTDYARQVFGRLVDFGLS